MGDDDNLNNQNNFSEGDNLLTNNDGGLGKEEIQSEVEWNDSQIIWDLAELERINRDRRNKPDLP